MLHPKVNPELLFLCSSAAAGRPPSPPGQGHLQTPAQVLARASATLPAPAWPPQPRAAKTPCVHPSVCRGTSSWGCEGHPEPSHPGAMGRRGQLRAPETARGRRKPFPGARGEQTRPGSRLPHAGQNQLLHQSEFAAVWTPNLRGRDLRSPYASAQTQTQSPSAPLQQNKDFKVDVTVIYIPEEKEKPFLVYRITQVAK